MDPLFRLQDSEEEIMINIVVEGLTEQQVLDQIIKQIQKERYGEYNET